RRPIWWAHAPDLSAPGLGVDGQGPMQCDRVSTPDRFCQSCESHQTCPLPSAPYLIANYRSGAIVRSRSPKEPSRRPLVRDFRPDPERRRLLLVELSLNRMFLRRQLALFLQRSGPRVQPLSQSVRERARAGLLSARASRENLSRLVL